MENKKAINSIQEVMEIGRSWSALKGKKFLMTVLGYVMPTMVAFECLEKSAMWAAIFMAMGNLSLLVFVVMQTKLDCKERELCCSNGESTEEVALVVPPEKVA